MFSFWFRTKTSSEDEVEKLIPLYKRDRGLTELYENDAELRVWIAEPLKVAIAEVAARNDMRMSAYFRQFFVIYLYGIHELFCMRDNKTGIFHPPPLPTLNSQRDEDRVLFSRARTVDYIPGLGKNIVPFKLYLHSKMKSDLAELAEKANMPLSQFVREILVSHFLGHTVWPQRNHLWTSEQLDIANGWVEGRIEEETLVNPTIEEEDALEGKIEFMW
jgi:hypothetical protein